MEEKDVMVITHEKEAEEMEGARNPQRLLQNKGFDSSDVFSIF